jgi:dTDP-4-amino-4,6-dideoxygalactose transaminase
MNPILTALAPLPPSIWMQRPSPRLPFPLDEPGCRLFSRGRHGLFQALRSAGLRADDEVLVPAYHHGSEIEVHVRAGLRCRFYDATETLEPDEDGLRRLLGRGTRALHLTHFLGFPQNAARWREWCNENGLLLIEDAAQAWLAEQDGRPVGKSADIAIYCLYKTFGLPDGAALFSRIPVPPSEGRRRLGAGAIGFDHALWMTSRSPLLSRLAQRLYRRRSYSADRDFALGDPASAPSIVTLLALPRLAHAEAAARRRRNYEALLGALGDHVPRAFRRLPSGASPFVFPIVSTDKTALLEHLRARGIRALDLWSTPHPALPAADYPVAGTLRTTVVGLPVHQELRDEDLTRIAATAREWLERSLGSANHPRVIARARRSSPFVE